MYLFPPGDIKKNPNFQEIKDVPVPTYKSGGTNSGRGVKLQQ